MIALKVTYFLFVSVIMGTMGASILLPGLKPEKHEQLFGRLVGAFLAKLLLGVGMLLLCWRVFGWSTTVAAFGMVSAYLVALLGITFAATRILKRGQHDA